MPASISKLLPSQVYSYEQLTAAASWVLNHNLGTYPIVEVFVTYEGELHKIIPLTIEYTSTNTCTVSFSAPFAGKATIV